jgi:hypothetical protein
MFFVRYFTLKLPAERRDLDATATICRHVSSSQYPSSQYGCPDFIQFLTGLYQTHTPRGPQLRSCGVQAVRPGHITKCERSGALQAANTAGTSWPLGLLPRGGPRPPGDGGPAPQHKPRGPPVCGKHPRAPCGGLQPTAGDALARARGAAPGPAPTRRAVTMRARCPAPCRNPGPTPCQTMGACRKMTCQPPAGRSAPSRPCPCAPCPRSAPLARAPPHLLAPAPGPRPPTPPPQKTGSPLRDEERGPVAQLCAWLRAGPLPALSAARAPRALAAQVRGRGRRWGPGPAPAHAAGSPQLPGPEPRWRRTRGALGLSSAPGAATLPHAQSAPPWPAPP